MFKRLAKKLYELGYEPIPVKGKVPVVKGWQRIEITIEIIETWCKLYPEHNIGVRNVAGIDVDIYNEPIAMQVQQEVIKSCGKAPLLIRYGQAPKHLIPVRLEGMRKMASKGYTDADGNINRIEALGVGNQWVVLGVHPDTGEYYNWEGLDGATLLSTHIDDLPLWSEELSRNTFTFYEGLADKEPTWNESIRRIDRQEMVTDGLESTNPHVGDLTPGDDYNRRVNIRDILPEYGWTYTGRTSEVDSGAALSEEWTRPGKDDGSTGGTVINDTLIVYSSNAHPLEPHLMDGTKKGKYSAWAVYTYYEHDGDFNASTKALSAQGYGITDAIEDFTDANEEDVLQLFLERFIFVTEENMVVDLQLPADRALMKLSEFGNTYCNRTPDGARVMITNQWKKHPRRKTVRATSFAPGRDRTFHDDQGVPYYNTFSVPVFPHTTKVDRLQPILDHFKYLLGEDGFDWYMSWVAHTVCVPGVRCTITPLLISANHGTGRGWIDDLMNKLLGPWNCSNISIAQLAGKGESSNAYQDYFYRKLYISIPEARASRKNMYEVDDAIREKLTASHLNINLKYGKYIYAEIFAQVHMTSNSRIPLIIERADRRIYVKECLDPPRSAEYYTQIYNLNTDPITLGQLWWWLKRRSDNVPFDAKGVAPKTREKRTLIEMVAGSPMAAALNEIVSDKSLPAVATYAQVRERLVFHMQEEQDDTEKTNVVIDEKQLIGMNRGKLMAANGAKRFIHKGKKVTAWILRDEKKWRDASTSEYRAELDKWDILTLRGLNILKPEETGETDDARLPDKTTSTDSKS